MYEKLVQSLRVEPFEVESAGLAEIMNEAADAIEELSKVAQEWQDAKRRASEMIEPFLLPEHRKFFSLEDYKTDGGST